MLRLDAKLRCRIWGDPDVLRGRLVSERDSRKIRVPDSIFALGIGAFGHSFSDCSGQFGEFVGIAGAAAYQPGDGSNIPDYVTGTGQAPPELIVVSSIDCEGAFSHRGEFERGSLADVAEAAMGISGASVVGIVLVAETAGLESIVVGVASRGDPERLIPAARFHAAQFSRPPHRVTRPERSRGKPVRLGYAGPGGISVVERCSHRWNLLVRANFRGRA